MQSLKVLLSVVMVSWMMLMSLSIAKAHNDSTYQFVIEQGTLTHLRQQLTLAPQTLQVKTGEIGQMGILVLGEEAARDQIYVFVDLLSTTFYFAERATTPNEIMREARRYGGILRASADRFDQPDGHSAHVNTRNTRLVINARRVE
ncbi:hypothetical protein [Thiomicrospira cyclica]|uniref:Uncharacterized protein n=1 Tax=Thiomicrospira cyclica (strain DSM 14477 / JCM 11371 / ALM1) TaxID=717773 RepID=F6DC43_THICA|nr:hypothetical protein [Thiomicrospira cyclica]AEG31429.1 hypothetical protein Thicy_0657 [Thiomicrospira cyclica ALM1]